MTNKLDNLGNISNIEQQLSNKADKNHYHQPTDIYQNSNYRMVSDVQINRWDNKPNLSDISGSYVPKNGSSTINGSLILTGELYSNNNVTAYSDYRLKENLQKIDYRKVKELLKSLTFYNFNMKNDELKRKKVGVIAQELEKIFPELVFISDYGYKSVDYIGLNTYINSFLLNCFVNSNEGDI